MNLLRQAPNVSGENGWCAGGICEKVKRANRNGMRRNGKVLASGWRQYECRRGYGTRQFGVGHALLTGGGAVGLLVLLMFLRVRVVRDGVHRRSLLAEAEQECESENEKHAPQHGRNSNR